MGFGSVTIPRRPRVTFIGGGSLMWMPTLLRDCCLTPELAGFELVLHDLDPAAVAVMVALGRKMIREFGADLSISSSAFRPRALAGARFVVIGISTGGLEAFGRDLAVTAAFGVRHPVGDTAGPAGISRALRNVPVFDSIARDVLAVCPDAWVLNHSNPMTALTRAMTRLPGVKAAGLCHGVREGEACIRAALGIPDAARVRVDAAGINHFAWAVRCRIDGRDGWPALEKAMKAARRRPPMPDYRLAVALFARHGAFPCNPDPHTAEFLPDVLGPGCDRGRRYGLTFKTIAGRRARLVRLRRRVREWLAGPVPPERSEEELTPVLAALVTGRPCEAVVNVPNQGQFADAPPDAVVESFGTVDHLGIRPLVSPPLPPAVRALALAHVRSEELTVEAALTGDRALLREAFAADPLARRVPRLGEMIDRLLIANRRLLPRFFPASR